MSLAQFLDFKKRRVLGILVGKFMVPHLIPKDLSGSTKSSVNTYIRRSDSDLAPVQHLETTPVGRIELMRCGHVANCFFDSRRARHISSTPLLVENAQTTRRSHVIIAALKAR